AIATNSLPTTVGKLAIATNSLPTTVGKLAIATNSLPTTVGKLAIDINGSVQQAWIWHLKQVLPAIEHR
ncbi:MAG: hypothetical protein IJ268_03315, partial [Proteobacteria bacterium]|nr:hypothetical protein [Pseudomonadota bacterium]